ncbi:unnamed protein product [Mytilus edulis]|uniref:Uncharacterized protein n=1 Tax=Mytilus edulis TaxID=6550 RepID=A0A8S3U1E7_MYTED|nr:unnamed protein product [Mytilus edulis]
MQGYKHARSIDNNAVRWSSLKFLLIGKNIPSVDVGYKKHARSIDNNAVRWSSLYFTHRKEHPVDENPSVDIGYKVIAERTENPSVDVGYKHARSIDNNAVRWSSLYVDFLMQGYNSCKVYRQQRCKMVILYFTLGQKIPSVDVGYKTCKDIKHARSIDNNVVRWSSYTLLLGQKIPSVDVGYKNMQGYKNIQGSIDNNAVRWSSITLLSERTSLLLMWDIKHARSIDNNADIKHARSIDNNAVRWSSPIGKNTLNMQENHRKEHPSVDVDINMQGL